MDSNELQQLLQRFDNYLNGSDSGYFDIAELFMIMEFYMSADNNSNVKEAYLLAKRLHSRSGDFKKIQALYEASRLHFERALELLQDYGLEEVDTVCMRIDFLLECSLPKEAQRLATDFINSPYAEAEIVVFILHHFISKSEFQKGLTVVKQALKLFPDSLELKFHHAQFCQALGRFRVAEKSYLNLIDIDPFMATAWYHLTEIYMMTGRFGKALEAVNYALAVSPHEGQWLLAKAHILSALHQFNEAIQTSLSALQEGADEIEVYLNIAQYYLSLDQHDNVMEWLKKAQKKSPQNVKVLLALFNTCLYFKDYKQAEEVVMLLTESDISDLELLKCTGTLQSISGDITAAVKTYKKALRLQPDDVESFIKLALLYCDLGKYKEAEKCLLKAADNSLFNEFIVAIFAVVYYKMGKYNKMLEVVDNKYFNSPVVLDFFFDLCPELKQNFKKIIDAVKNNKDFQSLLVFPDSVADNT